MTVLDQRNTRALEFSFCVAYRSCRRHSTKKGVFRVFLEHINPDQQEDEGTQVWFTP